MVRSGTAMGVTGFRLVSTELSRESVCVGLVLGPLLQMRSASWLRMGELPLEMI